MSSELSRRRLKELSSIRSRREREDLGVYLAEGPRLVASALEVAAPVTQLVHTHEAAESEQIASLLVRAPCPRFAVSNKDFGRISNVVSDQGLVAVLRLSWKSESEATKAERLLFLDGVQDPGNVGTLIRTAAWFGFDGVVIGPETADPFGSKAVRSSMGGIWGLDLFKSADAVASIQHLADAGFDCFSANAGGTSIDTLDRPARFVLVLGSEAHGVDPRIEAVSRAVVSIPGSAKTGQAVESLNVAVAGGILMAAMIGLDSSTSR